MYQKKIYLCCKKEKKYDYERLAQGIYRDAVRIEETLTDEVELMLIIQPETPDMEAEIAQAKAWSISSLYMTTRFIPVKLYQDILDNRSILK